MTYQTRLEAVLARLSTLHLQRSLASSEGARRAVENNMQLDAQLLTAILAEAKGIK